MKMLNKRFLHRIAVPYAAIPILVVVLTGILLLLRSDFESIQPKTRAGSAKGLSIDIASLIDKVSRENPHADIKEVRVVPSKGIVKVIFKDYLEQQYDAHNGELLHQGKKWSSFIVSLHEGSIFSPWLRNFVFLPSALLLLVLWFTGVSMYLRKS